MEMATFSYWYRLPQRKYWENHQNSWYYLHIRRQKTFFEIECLFSGLSKIV